MRTLGTILAVIGGVWVVGRISRRSPNHPINAIPALIPVASSETVYPVDGPSQETAQIQGSLIAGEGGGE
jgi:hypothetical protein